MMGYRLDKYGLIPSRKKRFPLLHSIQKSSEVHPAFYPMGSRGYFPRVKQRRIPDVVLNEISIGTTLP
jgi:hypothetical protein